LNCLIVVLADLQSALQKQSAKIGVFWIGFEKMGK